MSVLRHDLKKKLAVDHNELSVYITRLLHESKELFLPELPKEHYVSFLPAVTGEKQTFKEYVADTFSIYQSYGFFHLFPGVTSFEDDNSLTFFDVAFSNAAFVTMYIKNEHQRPYLLRADIMNIVPKGDYLQGKVVLEDLVHWQRNDSPIVLPFNALLPDDMIAGYGKQIMQKVRDIFLTEAFYSNPLFTENYGGDENSSSKKCL